jgi:PhnB protein
MLNCGSEKEIKNCYEKLSSKDKKDHSLEDSFGGTLFGDLTDKFENHWLLHIDKNQKH